MSMIPNMYVHIARFDSMLRRLFDITAAAVGLSSLSPLLAAVGIMIKAHDSGPVFYRATRVGQDGRLFRLYKFRTMVIDADRQGPPLTANGDARITPIGRWLRCTKLDELPQLLNVLMGDMSLVGPRPEDPRYVAQYTPKQKEVLKFRPGITSAASLAYRREEEMLDGLDWEKVYQNEVLPAKLAIDLDYFSKRTLASDLLLIVRTVFSLFR